MDEAMNVESADDLVDDVLAVLSDPRLSGVQSEPVRSVVVSLALLEPNHTLSRWVLTTLGGVVQPDTAWPNDDPLRPFDDARLVGHEGVLRVAAWLPELARQRAPTSALNRAVAVRDVAYAQFAAAQALADPSVPELRPLAESGLRALNAADVSSALSALADLERLRIQRRLQFDDSAALAALDQLVAGANPLELDGATRRALQRFRDGAHQTPSAARVLHAAAQGLTAENRTPAIATVGDDGQNGPPWWQPVRLRVLPPMPRRIAMVSMFLLAPALVLLARDPLIRSVGPVVEIQNVGQLSVLVFAASMLMLGWGLGALTRLFASHHSRLALLPICGLALFSTTHAQWVRRVVGSVLVSPTSEGIGFDSAERGQLGIMLFVSFALRVAALGAPILVLLYRARPHRRRLADVAALAIGAATALPGIAVVVLRGVGGSEPALIDAVGTNSVSAAIASQIAATTMVLLYLLLPLACFEVFEALRGAVESVGNIVRERPVLQRPFLLLAVKAAYIVAGFTGLLPAVIGGDRGVWDAPPERFMLAGLAIGGAVLVGFLLAKSGDGIAASSRWWVLIASVTIFSSGVVEVGMNYLSISFPNAFPFTRTLADPNLLSREANAILPWATALVGGLVLLALRRRGPAFCLLLAAFVSLPEIVRVLGDGSFDLFGLEEFDVVLTAFVAGVLVFGRRRDGVATDHWRIAATVLLAVSTAVAFGSVAIDVPARGAYVGALVLATALAIFRASDLNEHARRSPETAAAIVVALLATAVVAALVLQFSLYFAGTTDGEPTLLNDWKNYVETASRIVAPLFVAVWFIPGLLGAKPIGREMHVAS